MSCAPSGATPTASTTPSGGERSCPLPVRGDPSSLLWETPFWYCSTIFHRSIGGIGDPLPILTSERHCHSERLFLYTIMLPIDLISCKLVLQLFLLCTFNFSGLLLLPVPTFLECVALMKSKMSQYLAWHFKMSHFQHLICYLYSIVNKI